MGSSALSPSTITDALTTVFTPSAWCSSVLNSYSSWGDLQGVIHVLQNGYSPGIGTGSLCWPPNFYNHNWYANEPQRFGVYSPGVCPSGYASSSTWISDGVTSAICCPSGFEPGTAIFGKCKKATTGPLVVAAASQSEIAVTTPFLAYDWAITVAWASSDLDSFKPASAPLLTAGVQSTSAPAAPASVPTRRSHPATSTASAASAASTATQTEDLGSHSTTSAASPTSASGLSTAAKAGIGVGAALGCLLILVLVAILVLMLRRQRQKRRDAEPGGHGQAAWRVQSSSTGNSSYFANQARAKQNGSYPYSEMDGARPDQQYPYAKPELEDSRGANPSRYYQAELAGS